MDNGRDRVAGGVGGGGDFHRTVVVASCRSNCLDSNGGGDGHYQVELPSW